MGREHRIQAALAPVFPLVPEMVAHCDDEAVIGAPFYVMTRVEGIIPRRELGVDLGEQQTATLCGGFWDVLVQLHSVDPAAAGLDSLGKGEGYVARQVSGWTTRLDNARTDDMGDWSDITDWLATEQPADVRQLPDPQRLPARQRRALARRPGARSPASSTGRWRRSATR